MPLFAMPSGSPPAMASPAARRATMWPPPPPSPPPSAMWPNTLPADDADSGGPPGGGAMLRCVSGAGGSLPCSELLSWKTEDLGGSCSSRAMAILIRSIRLYPTLGPAESPRDLRHADAQEDRPAMRAVRPVVHSVHRREERAGLGGAEHVAGAHHRVAGDGGEHGVGAVADGARGVGLGQLAEEVEERGLDLLLAQVDRGRLEGPA